MSNVIPDSLDDPQVQPYCIWNPDIALEDTYREIVRRYPTMRYQLVELVPLRDISDSTRNLTCFQMYP